MGRFPGPRVSALCAIEMHTVYAQPARYGHRSSPGFALASSSTPLITRIKEHNVNRTLKKAREIIKIADAARYKPHSFRRGAAPELKEAAAQWSVAAGAGGCRSLIFMGFADISDVLFHDIAKILSAITIPNRSTSPMYVGFENLVRRLRRATTGGLVARVWLTSV